MIYLCFPHLQRVSRKGLQRVNLQRVTFCKFPAKMTLCKGEIVQKMSDLRHRNNRLQTR